MLLTLLTRDTSSQCFLPPELAYRAVARLSEDPWFTLLREEVSAAGTVLAIALDCTLSIDREDALSTFLTLAITLASASEPVQPRLQSGFDLSLEPDS